MRQSRALGWEEPGGAPPLGSLETGSKWLWLQAACPHQPHSLSQNTHVVLGSLDKAPNYHPSRGRSKIPRKLSKGPQGRTDEKLVLIGLTGLPRAAAQE